MTTENPTHKGRKKTSKYWGVSRVSAYGDRSLSKWMEAHPWVVQVRVNGVRKKKHFATEREAAIYADRVNLEHNLGKPLNILKPR